jgi:putative ABC transport system permease protein
MENVVLALRNIGRNRRRSLVTMLAVALSCGGLTLFGGYVSWTFRGVEMQTVGTYGHIQISKQGYYENGGGDPARYALDNYDEIKRLLLDDPVLGPRIELVTGQILFNGLVTSASTRMSSTFIGLGVIPSEDDVLWQWNPYGLTPAKKIEANAHLFDGAAELSDEDIEGGSVGIGLGRILKLDRPMEIAAPTPTRTSAAKAEALAGNGPDVDLAFLVKQAAAPALTATEDRARVELLVSPPEGGIPNVVTMGVRRLMPRATKEFDDQLIKLTLQQASELLFPGQPPHVTNVLVLLKQTADTDLAMARIQELTAQRGLPLEFRRWLEIRPFYLQLRRMLGIIFVFVFVLLAMLVAFTIYNTQSAGIIERMSELGTLRALGVDRWGIWRMLMFEGFFLGLFGGLLGVLLGIGGDLLFRATEIVYVPPGVSFFAKVEVLVLRDPMVMVVAFAGSLLCAVASSAFPARRAAFTPIVEALRHV